MAAAGSLTTDVMGSVHIVSSEMESRSGFRRKGEISAKNIQRGATAGDRNVTMFTLPGLSPDQSQAETRSE